MLIYGSAFNPVSQFHHIKKRVFVAAFQTQGSCFPGQYIAASDLVILIVLGVPVQVRSVKNFSYIIIGLKSKEPAIVAGDLFVNGFFSNILNGSRA